MTVCKNKLSRGDLGLPKEFLLSEISVAEGNDKSNDDEEEEEEENARQVEEQTPAKVLYCHVMDNASTDVICPWCDGHGSVTEDRKVVAPEIETEQLAERLRTQLSRVKTALHMASNKIKELQKKPKRRNVNVQVDEKSIDMECGGADAEHHDEDDASTHDTEALMEQASQAIQAMSELKDVKREFRELKRTLAAKETLLNKRKDEIHRLKIENDVSKDEINILMEGVHESEGMKLKYSELEKELNELKKQLQSHEHSNRTSHLDHATAVGNRLKVADMEIHKLTNDLLLKDVEIGTLKRDIEEALKIAAMSHNKGGGGISNKGGGSIGDDSNSSCTIVEKCTATTQTHLEIDWSILDTMKKEKDNQTKAEERAKTWQWLTQTQRDMMLEQPEVEEDGRLVHQNKRTTVRDALEARKWLISKQAIMNWGVLTQTLLNIMEVGQYDEICEKEKRLEWMKRNKIQMVNNRRLTTERILNGVTNLLIGGEQPASYIPKTGFQPFMKHVTAFKYRASPEKQKFTNINNNDRRSSSSSSSSNGILLSKENVNENYNECYESEQRVEGYYKIGVPELGSFPNRRTLFSGSSRRLTRVPLSSSSSPRGLPINGLWHSSSSNNNYLNKKKRPSSKNKNGRITNPTRPATARSPRTVGVTYNKVGTGMTYVRQRPKSAAMGKAWI
jgi:hypothetical protein